MAAIFLPAVYLIFQAFREHTYIKFELYTLDDDVRDYSISYKNARFPSNVDTCNSF